MQLPLSPALGSVRDKEYNIIISLFRLVYKCMFVTNEQDYFIQNRVSNYPSLHLNQIIESENDSCIIIRETVTLGLTVGQLKRVGIKALNHFSRSAAPCLTLTKYTLCSFILRSSVVTIL